MRFSVLACVCVYQLFVRSFVYYYSEEELSGLEEAEDEWWAQGGRGRGGGCVPVL